MSVDKSWIRAKGAQAFRTQRMVRGWTVKRAAALAGCSEHSIRTLENSVDGSIGISRTLQVGEAVCAGDMDAMLTLLRINQLAAATPGRMRAFDNAIEQYETAVRLAKKCERLEDQLELALED